MSIWREIVKSMILKCRQRENQIFLKEAGIIRDDRPESD